MMDILSDFFEDQIFEKEKKAIAHNERRLRKKRAEKVVHDDTISSPLHPDGVENLRIALGRVRANNYRKAYGNYRKNPSENNLSRVVHWGVKLCDPFTGCTLEDLAFLRHQVNQGKSRPDGRIEGDE